MSKESEKKEPNSTPSEAESPLERYVWPLRTIPRGEVKAGSHGYFDGTKGSIYIQRGFLDQLDRHPRILLDSLVSPKVVRHFGSHPITVWIEDQFEDKSVRISWKPERTVKSATVRRISLFEKETGMGHIDVG